MHLALHEADGTTFEDFFKSFGQAVYGPDFLPIGGMHDGGADGAMSSNLFEDQSRTGYYFQASIVENIRQKIRDTVKSLEKSRGNIRQLTYFSSRIVPNTDTVEHDLSVELNIPVQIRDRQWITNVINRNDGTKAAYSTHLEPLIFHLIAFGGAKTLPNSSEPEVRALQVFLGQEVERGRSNSTLLTSVTDTLILWALEGTDPDQKIFRTREEILQKIEAILPSAKHFVRSQIDERLGALSRKTSASGRSLNFHKGVGYCLPYDTRQLMEEENAEDEFLKIEVLDILTERAEKHALRDGLQDDVGSYSEVASIALDAICKTFEYRGLELATSLKNQTPEKMEVPVNDVICSLVFENVENQERRSATIRLASSIIRSSFYDSDEKERIYFGKLSRTYSLLFFLRAEPRIVEYFQNMSSRFHLFVGSDILVRALSETLLSSENMMTSNLLKILSASGATLLLAEPVIDEVYNHLRNSDLEFRHNVQQIETRITVEMASQVPMIMVRAYLYGKLNQPGTKRRPAGWKSFVGNFCTYENLYKQSALDELRDLFLTKYKMTFISKDDLLDTVDEDELEELTLSILHGKKKFVSDIEKATLLAQNDALLILGVYGRRRSQNETHTRGIFGFRTWWLTQESHLLRYTARTVEKRRAHHMMRPDFLLNYISLAPSMEDVRQAYLGIFPTLLGLKLSNRVPEDVYIDMMKRTENAYEHDEDRGSVLVANLSDRLAADQRKQYETKLFDGL